MSLSDNNYKNTGLQNKHLPAQVVPLPVFFAKTPVFTPLSRNVNRKNEVRIVDLEEYYGYSNIKIKGLPLNINMDFKNLAFLLKLRDQTNENVFKVNVLDFIEMCGGKRRSASKSTKQALIESFERLCAQIISFKVINNKDGSVLNSKIGSLINNIDTNFEEGFFEVEFNKNIQEIYNYDKFVHYVNMKTFFDLEGEVSKTLWLFYDTNSKFVKFTRSNILKRLQLKQKENKEINRQIRKAHEELRWMGYLVDFSYDKVSDTFTIKRHKNKTFD